MRRRTFVRTTIGLSAAAGFIGLQGFKNKEEKMQKRFVHHVYFWLKDPADAAVIARFEGALKKLVSIQAIQEHHLGKPASTRREVIDSSYQYSLLTLFKDQLAHDEYQVHPVHDEFRVVAGELCSKLLVYDSIPME